MSASLHSLPSRQLHPRSGSPINGVLEGREMVAGGETTGSCGVPSVLPRRAPAGAREACGDTTSPSSARFSRPSRALPSSTMGDRVDPVVAPPATLSRASGTQSGPHSPLCGALTATGHSSTGLSLRMQDFGAQTANGTPPAFTAPHRGLCGPLSTLTPR